MIIARMALLSVLTVFSSVLYAGIKHAGVAIGSILSSVAPMFAISLGVIFLREPLPARALLALSSPSPAS